MAKKHSGRRLPLSQWRSLMQKTENKLNRQKAENRKPKQTDEDT